MSRFFIDRPVFAWVIAILIMGVGGSRSVVARSAISRDCAAPISITAVPRCLGENSWKA